MCREGERHVGALGPRVVIRRCLANGVSKSYNLKGKLNKRRHGTLHRVYLGADNVIVRDAVPQPSKPARAEENETGGEIQRES